MSNQPKCTSHSRSRSNTRGKSELVMATHSQVWRKLTATSKSITYLVIGKGKFDPRVPIEQPDEEGDDVLICTDVREAFEERLQDKPQRITQVGLLDAQTKGILLLYENDVPVVQHVIKQQLCSEHMTGSLRS